MTRRALGMLAVFVFTLGILSPARSDVLDETTPWWALVVELDAEGQAAGYAFRLVVFVPQDTNAGTLMVWEAEDASYEGSYALTPFGPVSLLGWTLPMGEATEIFERILVLGNPPAEFVGYGARTTDGSAVPLWIIGFPFH